MEKQTEINKNITTNHDLIKRLDKEIKNIFKEKAKKDTYKKQAGA